MIHMDWFKWPKEPRQPGDPLVSIRRRTRYLPSKVVEVEVEVNGHLWQISITNHEESRP